MSDPASSDERSAQSSAHKAPVPSITQQVPTPTTSPDVELETKEANQGTIRARTPRPQGMTMPAPPTYNRTPSGSHGHSHGLGDAQQGQGYGPLRTPTGSDTGNSPGVSPSVGGPMSPGPNLAGKSYIFPIRSVYQNMSSDEGSNLARVNSRGGRGNSPHRDRRPSMSEAAQDDAGIASIAQMLEGQALQSNSSTPRQASSGQQSVATFSGKIDRSMSTAGIPASQSHGNNSSARASPAQASGSVPTSGVPAAAPAGFFSVPLPDRNESSSSPFFADVQASTMKDGGQEEKSAQGSDQAKGKAEAEGEPHRPTLKKEGDSHETVKDIVRASSTEPQLPSSPTPAPDRNKATSPNEPQSTQGGRRPSVVNYVNRPGPQAGHQPSFSARKPPLSNSAHQAVELQHPKPRPGYSSNRSNDSTRSSQPVLEVGEDGMQLVNDFSGIVRLGEAGSFTQSGGTRTGTGTGTQEGESGTGTGSRSRSKRSKDVSEASKPTGAPTAAKLAQQNKAIGKNTATTRDNVRDFIEDQRHTENMMDPNAPTPTPGQTRGGSPYPLTPSDDDSSVDAQYSNTNLGKGYDSGGAGRLWDGSDASMSVRDSSEMATASGEGDRSGDLSDNDEPIVTMRFEHMNTEDGHHVVVGREGTLRRCEDEPITTPGAVQGFGVLIVLEEDYDTGILVVRQVSENATELLGLSPRYLFRLDCFSRILTHDQEDILRDNIDYLPDANSTGTALEDEGPQVFLLSGFGEPGSDDSDEDQSQSSAGGRRREWTAWVGAHRPKQPTWDKVDENGKPIPAPDLIILEFELERDVYNPLMQTFEPAHFSSGGLTPDSGSQTTLSAGSGKQSGTMTSDSAGSKTTVGSTPRPPLQPHTSESTNGSATVKQSTSSVQVSSLGSRPSSKLPKGMEPMGLDGIEVEMPLERIIESTTNHAKPLRALERMRRSGNGEDSQSGSGSGSRTRGGRPRRPQRRAQPGTTGTMDVFAILGQINDQLGSAPDLDTFLKIVVGVVQDVCRFHRVLLYQFDEAYNGQVVAELVEWGKTTDLYKGLMFPAADIPAQARELYKINKVRLLYDRSQTTARLVLRSKEDLDHPLDMTHCFLRAMSPIHIKYLANMHVRSSMSVSIMAFGQLWGLIACHSYGHHGMRVSFPVRQMMRILSDSISRNIERLSYAQRLHTRKLISTIPTQHHPTGYIVSNADDLLQIFDADAGLLVIGDGCKLLGQSEQGQAMLAIAEYFRILKFDNMKATNHISRDFPDLILPRATDMISGLMYVPLTARAGQDFIVFLRKGQAKEVKWAGKPYKDEASGEAASLEPRKSFKTWSEIVTGRSRAWTDDQMESAGVLALIYGKFIQVWREKQSAMASNQLTAILLSNTSHAVRTPLSQIINTLELALSGDIDPDTRNMLENSHQASRALLFHVHDLLDLTRIETGNETAFNDPFDLRQTIQDAVRLYQTESERRNIDFRVNLDSNLPQSVIGDSRKIKTVISNLVANSVKFTENGWIEVYCGVQQSDNSETAVAKPGYVPLEFVVADTGVGIPNDKLQAMFVTLEGVDEAKATEPTGLGLGLAVVARIVEQLSGQLRAESEQGVGSRFFFTLQMLEHDGRELSRTNSVNSSLAPRGRTGSSGSGSVASLVRSDAKSEIESFVQDFGNSHMLGPVSKDDSRLKDAETRMNRPGTFPVTDSSYPVRPSRVESDEINNTDRSPRGQAQIAGAPAPASPGRPGVPRRITAASGTSSQLSEDQRQAPASHGGSSLRQAHERSPTTPITPSFASRHAQAHPLAHERSHSLGHEHAGLVHAAPHAVPVKQASGSSAGGVPLRSKRGPKGEQKLRVLVVEDDMINSQILQKRLKMDKHSVIVASNGQEGVDALKKDWDVDAVLMDIQMPIMDGRLAAQTIRELEAKIGPQDDIDPLRVDDRIPIFAVSASLYESDRQSLMQHFDGWLLKPLDFGRVRDLFKALEDPQKRRGEMYVQGQWERGGYLRDAASLPKTPK